MCLLLLHHRTREDWPLVLLANRDESYDRPFASPALRDAQDGIVAPRDLRAGGTWLGRNRHGLVAAITNRQDPVPARARSRGLLVSEALRKPDARAAADWAVEHLAGETYGGFHLLLADAAHASVIRHRPAEPPARPTVDRVDLSPGSHVLTNRHELDELSVPPGGEIDPDEPILQVLSRLQRLAADGRPSLPGGHRVFRREAERGTVCSAIVAIPSDAEAPWIFRFAAGPPDRVPFVPVLPPLDQVGRNVPGTIPPT